MKSNLVAIIGFVLVVSLAVFVTAESLSTIEDADLEASSVEDLNVEDVGVLPSQAGYGLKLGWERFKLWFIFNQEKKAQQELKLARLRLLEAKLMAERGNFKAMRRAQEAHDRLMERVKRRVEKIGEARNEKSFRNSVEKLASLEKAIEVHEHRIELLKDLLESNLTDEQRELLEGMIARMENATENLKQIEERKKENLKTRLKTATGKSEEEIKKIIEEIENKNGLNVTRKLIAEKRIENTERALTKLKTRVEEEKIKGLNVSYFEEQIGIVESNLQLAKEKYEEGNYTAVIEILKPTRNYGRSISVMVHKVNEARMKDKKRVATVMRDLIEKNKKLTNSDLQKIKKLRKRITSLKQNRNEQNNQSTISDTRKMEKVKEIISDLKQNKNKNQ